MAVEIPVFIDIEKAFEDAASRIPQAMKPMQKYMDDNALAIKLKIDDSGKKFYVKQILDDATMSAKQLQTAIQDIGAKIKKRADAGGFDLSKELTATEKNFLQVAGALEYKLTGVSDKSATMGRIFAVNVGRAKKKVAELTASLDELTKKQNQYYRTVDGKRVPGGIAFENLKKRIAQTNKELISTKNFLGYVTDGLMSTRKAGVQATAAIAGMKTPAMEMAEQWRRGAAYVEKYNAGLSRANNRLGMLVKNAISLVALHASLSFVRNVREVTSEFELQRVALGGIIQDTERAEKLFKQIKAAAIQSPFEIKDLVTFTKQLSAYRIETENLFSVTMKLADVSAGLGIDMNRLVLAYGQVRAAAVLRGQELRQFTEAGIPLVSLLAEKFRELGREGITTADVFELISKRAVPFSMIEEIFNDMTSAGGIFYKMQEKQAETLKGQWMKLKDALSIMYDEIGNTDAVHGAMETLMKDAMRLMQNWREVSKYVGLTVSAFVAYKVAVVNARIAQNALTAAQAAEISALQLNVVTRSKLIATLFGEAAATKVEIALSNAYVWAKRKELIATNLFTRALYKMIAALLANPYAIAIAGITALVALLIKYTKKSQEAKISNEELQRSLTSFNKSKEHAKDINDLCDAYDKLSKKANRTEEEEKKLARVTKDLSKAYPSAISGVNEHTKAIELDTAAIRERNKATMEAIRLSFEEDKRRGEANIEKLQYEYDRIAEILERGSVKMAAYNTEWYEPITEEQKTKFGERLRELEAELQDAGAILKETEDAMEDFVDDLVGPVPPDFLGDAWRLQLNQYKTTLKSTGMEVKAFQKDQIEGFEDQKDAMNEVAKEYKKQTELVDFYTKTLDSATGARKKQTEQLLEDAKLMQGLFAQILTDWNAWDLVKEKGGKPSYQEDPFIKAMENRMKFMQDFKKGYDDLNKYMSTGGALAKQLDIMQARGLSIGIDPAEQKRAARELSAWYQDAINEAFEEAKKHGASGSITAFMSKQIEDKTSRGKMLKSFQDLIHSLWDAKTDFDTSQLKKDLEDALKRVTEEVKRSDTVRNFFQNILDFTGDEEVARSITLSVYGEPGADFKDSLQKQLDAAFMSLDWTELPDDIWGQLATAINTQDFNTIIGYIGLFPTEWQAALRQMSADNEKFNANWVSDILETYQKTKSFEERMTDVRKREEQKRKKIADSELLSDEKKATLTAASTRKEAEDIASIQVEALKATYEWTKAFEDLDRVGNKTLTGLRDKIVALIEAESGNLTAEELKTLRQELEKINDVLAERDPFSAIVSGGNRMLLIMRAMKQSEGTEAYSEAIEKIKKFNETAKDSDKIDIDHLEDSFRDANKDLEKGISGVADYLSAWKSVIDTVSDAFNLDEVPVLGETLEGVSDALSFVASILPVIITLNGILNGTLMANPFIAIGAAIVATIGAIVGLIKGIVNAKVERLNKKIEEQTKLIDNLERSYKRLEKAMESAFGADYIFNYTKKLENLAAQQAAYEEQARLEREKGKKADQDKIDDYLNSAKDAKEELEDMKGELSRFFTDTDVTSAAEDFATAWIDAYKEFSSTTDAMKEKFEEMVQSMITKSLAAKITQSVLQPLFDQIDEMAVDGQLSAEEIAQIANQTTMYTNQMNDALTSLAVQLAAAGYNIRRSAGNFTGIKRDIANASEESINGLAAGINTQNFYMQLISQNVAAILAVLTGGAEVAGPAGAAAVTDPYKDQMLQYVSSLPQMRDDIAAMRSMWEKVIRPNGTSATHYVATR